MSSYPWYSIFSSKDPLQQGDFLNSCPVVVPKTDLNLERINIDIIEYDIIILSQSCDLIYKKLDLVLVCPVWSFKEIEEESKFYRSLSWKNAIKSKNNNIDFLSLLTSIIFNLKINK